MLGRSIRISAVLTLGFSVGFLSCGGAVAVEPIPDDATLSLLGPGRFIGTTSYGNAPGPDEAASRSLITQAAAAGMNGFAFGEDWRFMEPTPGSYDLTLLRERLTWLDGLGITPYFNISVVDIGDLNLPPEFLDETGTRLAPGVRLDDAVVIARFNSLLDQVVPVLVRHRGFYLGVGNEVDARFEDFPDELDPYIEFVRAVREHARSIDPRLAVGATVTGTAVLERRPTFLRLRAVSDVVPFNLYNVDNDTFLAMGVERTLADLDRAISNYGSGPIIIQELGCTSSAAQNSSDEIQGACFQAYFEALAQRYPQVRFAATFTLQDLDQDVCDAVVAFFGFAEEGLPPEVTARLRGFLCEIGLRAANGSSKTAWDEFLNATRTIDAN